MYSSICQVGGSKDRLAAAMEQAETVEAEHHQQQLAATATDMEVEEGPASPPQDMSPAMSGATCLPQREALLKSMLNFLKKAIQVGTTLLWSVHLRWGIAPQGVQKPPLQFWEPKKCQRIS